MVALVGVQSNQYPRALDIARPLREAQIPVVMGGFHVSGCLSMLDGHAVDLDACRELGISVFAGEAENRLDAVLRDASEGRLAPVYDFIADLSFHIEEPTSTHIAKFVTLATVEEFVKEVQHGVR